MRKEKIKMETSGKIEIQAKEYLAWCSKFGLDKNDYKSLFIFCNKDDMSSYFDGASDNLGDLTLEQVAAFRS